MSPRQAWLRWNDNKLRAVPLVTEHFARCDELSGGEVDVLFARAARKLSCLSEWHYDVLAASGTLAYPMFQPREINVFKSLVVHEPMAFPCSLTEAKGRELEVGKLNLGLSLTSIAAIEEGNVRKVDVGKGGVRSVKNDAGIELMVLGCGEAKDWESLHEIVERLGGLESVYPRITVKGGAGAAPGVTAAMVERAQNCVAIYVMMCDIGGDQTQIEAVKQQAAELYNVHGHQEPVKKKWFRF